MSEEEGRGGEGRGGEVDLLRFSLELVGLVLV